MPKETKTYPLKTVRQAWGAGRFARKRNRPRLWGVVREGSDGLFSGEVTAKFRETITIELWDAVTFFFGLTILSGELRQFDRSCVRLFNDGEAAANATKDTYRAMCDEQRNVTTIEK